MAKGGRLPDDQNPRRISDKAGGNPEGETTSPMNAVTARGDSFRNALTVYGNGAQDLAGNLGPITANSGTMEYTRNLLDQKTRVAALSDSLVQGPRKQNRSLAEIDAAMRGDELALQRDISNKELEARWDSLPQNNKDVIDIAAEGFSTAVGLNKGLRAITKGFGDEEMAYDPKKWRELYDAKIAAAKASGQDVDTMPPEQSLKLLERFNAEALEESKGKHIGFKDNPAAYVADQLAAALEVLPGIKQLRAKNIATAEEERISEKYRLTPEMGKQVGRMMSEHQERLAKIYGEGSPEIDRQLSIYFGQLEQTIKFRLGAGSGDWLGNGGQGVRDYYMLEPVSVSPVTFSKDGPSIDYGPTPFKPLFEIIEDGESSMFEDRWNAFNRGAAGDSLIAAIDEKGNTVYRIDENGKKVPKMRVVQADEIWDKKLTEMTVGEIRMNMDNSDPSKELGASGFFQITEVALQEAIDKGIVKSDDMYDMKTQTKLGIWTLTEKRPDIKAYINSQNPTYEMRHAAAKELAKEYESMGDPDNAGFSHYLKTNADGTKENKPARIHHIDTMQALEKTRIAIQREHGYSSGSNWNNLQNVQDRLVLDTFNKNMDKDFIRRAARPESSLPGIKGVGADGRSVEMSHQMGWAETEVDGKTKYAVYPNVMPERSFTGAPIRLKDYGKSGWDEAKSRGEYVLFDDKNEADWFSKNYKRLWGRK
jgi:hypothetical protein